MYNVHEAENLKSAQSQSKPSMMQPRMLSRVATSQVNSCRAGPPHTRPCINGLGCQEAGIFVESEQMQGKSAVESDIVYSNKIDLIEKF